MTYSGWKARSEIPIGKLFGSRRYLGLQVVQSDLLCSFEAVHDRHVEVHDNYVEE